MLACLLYSTTNIGTIIETAKYRAKKVRSEAVFFAKIPSKGYADTVRGVETLDGVTKVPRISSIGLHASRKTAYIRAVAVLLHLGARHEKGGRPLYGVAALGVVAPVCM